MIPYAAEVFHHRELSLWLPRTVEQLKFAQQIKLNSKELH